MKKSTQILEKLITEFLQSKKPDGHSLLDKFSAKLLKQSQWNDAEMGNKQEVKTEILGNIHQQLGFHEQKTKYKIGLHWSVAASVILLLGAALFWNYSYGRSQMVHLYTQAQMDSVLLADGTKVYLSPYTDFSYPKQFSEKKREVNLKKGNAFFEVTHNQDKPFVVVSGTVQTKVLGTSFNINLNSQEYKVLVHTGMVRVSSEEQSVMLTPCQEACFSYEEHSLESRVVNPNSILAWYQNEVVLNQVSLQDILSVIKKKYGAEIEVPDSTVLSTKATVHINQRTTLQSVINQINYITSLNLRAHERKLED